MTIERPTFPPRAESVDSFSHQPAVDHRPHERPAGDSPKPAQGLSRRLALAGLATASVAWPAAAAEPDPVFAAIERYKVLSAEYTAAVDRRAPLEDDDPDLLEAEDDAARSSTALFEQMDVIFTFRPSTVAGVVALLKYISTLEDWQMPPGLEESDSMKAVKTLCTCVAAAIDQSGVQS
jgi:hypothetical protein